MGRRKGRKNRRDREHSHIGLARTAVLRNLLLALIIAAGAVLIVFIVLGFSGRKPAQTSTAPENSALVVEVPQPRLAENGEGLIYPGSEGEIRDYTEAELAAGFEITLACGCKQKYKWEGMPTAIVNGRTVEAHGPGPKQMIEAAKRRSCRRCQQLLEYRAAKEALSAAENGGGNETQQGR